MAVVDVEEASGMAAVDAWMQVLRANVGRVGRAGDSPHSHDSFEIFLLEGVPSYIESTSCSRHVGLGGKALRGLGVGV